MRFMVLVKASAESEAGEMPTEQALEAMGAFNEELVNAGVMLDGAGLKPTSAGARVTFAGDERIVARGPFADAPTGELVAGYWLWQCADLDEALEWAKRCPAPMPGGGTLEIRPLFEAEDFGDSPAVERMYEAERAQRS